MYISKSDSANKIFKRFTQPRVMYIHKRCLQRLNTFMSLCMRHKLSLLPIKNKTRHAEYNLLARWYR